MSYVKNVKAALCPATRNFIRQNNAATTTNPRFPQGKYLPDLGNNALNLSISGTSYEVFGTLPRLASESTSMPGQKKTEQHIQGREYFTYTKLKGSRMGPSHIFMIVDGDDNSGNAQTQPGNTHNNYPDPGNNHGATGTCMQFCDGHAMFVPLSKFLDTWNTGSDGNATAP